MSRDNLAIVKAILSKTVARGATPSEEASAVAKAVEMMAKYGIPVSAVASVWPDGWDFSGKRCAVKPKPKPTLNDKRTYHYPRHATSATMDDIVAEALRRMMAAEARRRAFEAAEQDAARRAEERRKAETASGAKAKPGSIREYAEYLLRLVRKDNGEAMTYAQIIKKISDGFPGSKTTVASLRWYESKMRAAGRTVPKRKP